MHKLDCCLVTDGGAAVVLCSADRARDLPNPQVYVLGFGEAANHRTLGRVLLADLEPDELEEALAHPSRSGITPRWFPNQAERDEVLKRVRENGWDLADGQLAPGVRSVAVPLRGASGRVIASMNVNTNAAETPIEKLLNEHLPLLRKAAERISRDWELLQSMPIVVRD